MLLQTTGCKEREKIARMKKIKRGKMMQSLPRHKEGKDYQIGVITWSKSYSELSTEEKVEMILMLRVAIILAKQQNSKIFGIFNHVLKSW